VPVLTLKIFVALEAPRDRTGYATGLGLPAARWADVHGMGPAAREREWKMGEKMEKMRGWRLVKEEVRNLGDDRPWFRFTF